MKNGAKKAPKIGALAQREGFEPPDVAINSFQDCRNRPLYHLCIKLLRQNTIAGKLRIALSPNCTKLPVQSAETATSGKSAATQRLTFQDWRHRPLCQPSIDKMIIAEKLRTILPPSTSPKSRLFRQRQNKDKAAYFSSPPRYDRFAALL